MFPNYIRFTFESSSLMIVLLVTTTASLPALHSKCTLSVHFVCPYYCIHSFHAPPSFPTYAPAPFPVSMCTVHTCDLW
ncbi:uncharacterized protein F5147DRAFT_678501 [Suillus discolor]|uniref:Secreted protein n=1 Tax=Suillus discolor TaxID=1912936 RepID=A0A9P7JXG3_9AGAM|nr:uncharacterized protein F5147DRAFT_678501 [Suillus discolor]KAG2114238.1 hypothetical protein F5147DRAFT_678501 [Suillus discolor]